MSMPTSARRLAGLTVLAALGSSGTFSCKNPVNPYGPTDPKTTPPPPGDLPPPTDGTSWVGWTPSSGLSGVQDPNGYCGVMRIEPSMRSDPGLTKTPLRTVRDLNEVIYDSYHWRNSDGAQLKIYRDRDDPSLFYVNVGGSTVKRTLPGSLFLNHDINSLGENAYSQSDLFGSSAYVEFVRTSLADALTSDQGFIKKTGVTNPKLVLMGHSQGANVASVVAWQILTGMTTEPVPPEASAVLGAAGLLSPRPALVTSVAKLRAAFAASGATIVGGVGTAGRPLGLFTSQNAGRLGLGNGWVFQATSRRELNAGSQLTESPGMSAKLSDFLKPDQIDLMKKAAPEIAPFLDGDKPILQIFAVQGLENDDPVPMLGTPGLLTTSTADADAGWLDLVRGPSNVVKTLRGYVGDVVSAPIDPLSLPFKTYKGYTDLRVALLETITGLRMAFITNRAYVFARDLVYFPDPTRTFVDAHGGSYIDGKLGLGTYLAAFPPKASSADAHLVARPFLERDVAQVQYGATRTIHVLANDWDALRRPFKIVSATAKLGKALPSADGRALVYTAPSEDAFRAAAPTRALGPATTQGFAVDPDDTLTYTVRYDDCDPARDLGPGGSCATPPTYDSLPVAVDLVHAGEDGLYAKGPFYSPEPPATQTAGDAAKLRVFPADAPILHYVPGLAHPATCAVDADCHGGSCDAASGSCRDGSVGLTYVGGYGFDCRKPHIYAGEKQHFIKYKYKTKDASGKEQEHEDKVDICDRKWYLAFDLGRNPSGDVSNPLDNEKVAAIEDAFDAEDFRGPDGVPDTLWVETDPATNPKGDKRMASYASVEAGVHAWTTNGADQTKWDEPPPAGGNMGKVRILNRAFVRCTEAPTCKGMFSSVSFSGTATACPLKGGAIDEAALRDQTKLLGSINPLRAGVEVPTVSGGACYGYFASAKVPVPCDATSGWPVEMTPVGGAATPVYISLVPGASQWSWAGQYTSDGFDALVGGGSATSLISTGSDNNPIGICTSARSTPPQKITAYPLGKYTDAEIGALGLPTTHACYDVLHFTVGGPFTPGCSVSTARGTLFLVLQSTCG